MIDSTQSPAEDAPPSTLNTRPTSVTSSSFLLASCRHRTASVGVNRLVLPSWAEFNDHCEKRNLPDQSVKTGLSHSLWVNDRRPPRHTILDSTSSRASVLTHRRLFTRSHSLGRLLLDIRGFISSQKPNPPYCQPASSVSKSTTIDHSHCCMA